MFIATSAHNTHIPSNIHCFHPLLKAQSTRETVFFLKIFPQVKAFIVNHNQTLLTLFTIVKLFNKRWKQWESGTGLPSASKSQRRPLMASSPGVKIIKGGKNLFCKIRKKNTYCWTCSGTAWQWPRTQDQRSQLSMRTDVPSTQPSSQGIER